MVDIISTFGSERERERERETEMEGAMGALLLMLA